MGKYRVTAVFADTELAGWGGGWYNCSLLPSTRSSVVGFVLSNIYTFQLLEFALLIKLFWWTCSPSPLQSHQIIVSHQILCIEKKNSEFIPRNDRWTHIFWVQSKIYIYILLISSSMGTERYFYLYWNLSSQVIYEFYCISDFKIEDLSQVFFSCRSPTNIILQISMWMWQLLLDI